MMRVRSFFVWDDAWSLILGEKKEEIQKIRKKTLAEKDPCRLTNEKNVFGGSEPIEKGQSSELERERKASKRAVLCVGQVLLSITK